MVLVFSVGAYCFSVQLNGNEAHVDPTLQTNEDKALNFILIDGTWSNSAAMFRRLKVILYGAVFYFAEICSLISSLIIVIKICWLT